MPELVLEPLDKPMIEIGYNDQGKKVTRYTTNLKKYRTVHKQQLYILIRSTYNNKRYKLIKPFYR